MPLQVLNEKLWFPPIEDALQDGLLAMGGDISPDRILLAYTNGIFPWYNGEVPLWWSPNPRFVLLPDELKISKSMKLVLKKNEFRFSINEAFEKVIQACKEIPRKGQDGTWLNPTMQTSYTLLHKKGFAHSAEVWQNNELVGGLYGIKIGKIFFGESMFSFKSNASKFAFIKYVEELKKEGITLIDCQVYTEHLESLGAKMIMREQFMQILKHYI
ncbi:MAG: leucyl/phenylalanyl-tRNA--protein transferase [Bacteroidetes bacterium]|nr:leucyl/phenylalanyl-tRNA--protein transferase [Bacteroidota bacterium]MBS1648194.1 leucyl/phenylalanyl-tRNA--protein transferase [Bacteroidota bacterium]